MIVTFYKLWDDSYSFTFVDASFKSCATDQICLISGLLSSPMYVLLQKVLLKPQSPNQILFKCLYSTSKPWYVKAPSVKVEPLPPPPPTGRASGAQVWLYPFPTDCLPKWFAHFAVGIRTGLNSGNSIRSEFTCAHRCVVERQRERDREEGRAQIATTGKSYGCKLPIDTQWETGATHQLLISEYKRKHQQPWRNTRIQVRVML